MQYPEIPNVEFMGDVHLGRRFIEGVPLERRGEREEEVWEQFEQDLNNLESGLVHIQVGDLFDTFDVPNEVVLRAANLYLEAARRLSSIQFFILRGNHDASRSDTRVSSFDLFKAIVGSQDNIWVVDQPMIYGTMGFMPWDPFKSAKEQAEGFNQWMPERVAHLDFIVCHCDTKAWNGNDFNVLPLDQLKDLTKIVVTGHEHIKRSFVSKGVTVHVTGSMQPYSHGEDPDHSRYWTGTPDELALLEDTSNLYLRVVLQPGETAPPIPNCLGYKVQIGAVEEEESDITVDFEEFDTTNIFKGILKELGVSADIQAQVLDKFTESLNA